MASHSHRSPTNSPTLGAKSKLSASSDGKFLLNSECRGIKPEKDLHLAKFRFNQQFRLVNAEEFIKQLLSSEEVQKAFKPLESLGTVANVTFKQINCTVLNMAYFDIFEELGIVSGHNGSIQGCMDEWLDGMQLCDKLR